MTTDETETRAPLRGGSVRMSKEEWEAIDAYRVALQTKEGMRLSMNAVIGRLIKIGLREATRRK